MMMSEQLFVLDKLYYTIMTPIEKISVGRSYMTYREVVDCLNEQQTTISRLEEENEQLRQFINKGRRLSVKELMDNVNENESLKKKIKGLEKENEKLKKRFNLLTDDDAYHYDRWIKQIKNYVDNEDFEYNEEFIIKLCLSYTLQSLRNGENLKRFQWDMVNDGEEKILRKSCENCGYFYLFDEEAIQISREIGEDLDGFGECHYHGDFFHKKGLCNKWMDE